jgi:hypothetical protein
LILGAFRTASKSGRSSRTDFWDGLDRNSIYFDLLPGKKRACFDQGRCNCLPKIARQRAAILMSCWFARRPFIITIQEVFEMTKQDETHRVMFTLTDQAIAKLDQLVAKKQQEVNQNPDLAKYHVRVTKSNIVEDWLSKQWALKSAKGPVLAFLTLTGTINALYIKNGLERKYKRSKPFLSA